MADSKWTDGPWVISGRKPINGFYIDGNASFEFDGRAVPQTVAMTTTIYAGSTAATDPAEEKANAHLIAAAPDMDDALRRCETLLSFICDANLLTEPLMNSLERVVLPVVREVRTKARGETDAAAAKGEDT